MILAVRKIAGTLSVFALAFIGVIISIAYLDAIQIIEKGKWSISYGQLPSGRSFEITKGLLVTVALGSAAGFLLAHAFWVKLKTLSPGSAALAAMIPVLALAFAAAIFIAYE